MAFNPEKIIGKQLGEGAEKKVYKHRHNKKLAVGVYHSAPRDAVESISESPRRVKARFYLTKIVHLLMPKNLPDIHLAASNPHMLITDRVAGYKPIFFGKNTEAKEGALINAFEDKAGVMIDPYRKNFMFNGKGNLVYIDSLEPFNICRYPATGEPKIFPGYDREKILKSIEKLDENEKEKALFYLKNLEALVEEEKEILKDKNYKL